MIVRLSSIYERLRSKSLFEILRHLPNLAHNSWYHWTNSQLDRKYNIDTQGIIDDLNVLAPTSIAAKNANGYEGIQIPVFKRILKHLRINPAEYTFVDLGSGKGRACIMAAEWGFANVIGVEFSPVLHAIAQQNIERFQTRHRSKTCIQLKLDDAATFRMPDANLVCFLYNPFDDVIIDQVIRNLINAQKMYGKAILIAYRNPVHAEIFDKNPAFLLLEKNPDFRLYQIKSSNKI